MYTQAKCERTRQSIAKLCLGAQQKTGRTPRSAGAPTDLSLHETFPGPCSRGRAGIFTSQDQRQPLLLEMACLLTVCNDRRHLLLGYSPFLSPPPPSHSWEVNTCPDKGPWRTLHQACLGLKWDEAAWLPEPASLRAPTAQNNEPKS